VFRAGPCQPHADRSAAESLSAQATPSPSALKPALAAGKWIEIKSLNFTVVSADSESATRTIAWEFEQIRAAVQTLWPAAPARDGDSDRASARYTNSDGRSAFDAEA
jgi:hypothetical protein